MTCFYGLFCSQTQVVEELKRHLEVIFSGAKTDIWLVFAVEIAAAALSQTVFISQSSQYFGLL